MFLISYFSFQSYIYKHSHHPRPLLSKGIPFWTDNTRGTGEEWRQNWVRMGECRRGEQCMCSEMDPVLWPKDLQREREQKFNLFKCSFTWSQKHYNYHPTSAPPEPEVTTLEEGVPPLARGHVTVPSHSAAAAAGTVLSADSSCDRDDQRTSTWRWTIKLALLLYLRWEWLLRRRWGGLWRFWCGFKITWFGCLRRGTGIWCGLFCIVLKTKNKDGRLGCATRRLFPITLT